MVTQAVKAQTCSDIGCVPWGCTECIGRCGIFLEHIVQANQASVDPIVCKLMYLLSAIGAWLLPLKQCCREAHVQHLLHSTIPGTKDGIPAHDL